jgi:hypothetical protein
VVRSSLYHSCCVWHLTAGPFGRVVRSITDVFGSPVPVAAHSILAAIPVAANSVFAAIPALTNVLLAAVHVLLSAIHVTLGVTDLCVLKDQLAFGGIGCIRTHLTTGPASRVVGVAHVRRWIVVDAR